MKYAAGRHDWAWAVGFSLTLHFVILLWAAAWVVPDAAMPMEIPVEMEWRATQSGRIEKVSAGNALSSTDTLPQASSGGGTPTSSTTGTDPAKGTVGNQPDKPVTTGPASSPKTMDGDMTGGLALIPPVLRDRPVLVYPEEARRAGVTGTVILTAEVQEDGGLDRIVVFRSSGSAILDAAAREHARQWKFSPARQAATQKAVRVATQIRIRFGAVGG